MDKIDDNISVSGQIFPQDVAKLTEMGIELIICNRPDNEDEGQPLFAEIKNAARALGVDTEIIAFSGSDMTKEQVLEFKELLTRGKKVHAYCRSGNRSNIIWEAALSV